MLIFPVHEMQKPAWVHSLSPNFIRKLVSASVQLETWVEGDLDGILVQMPERNTGKQKAKMLRQCRSILMLKMNGECQKTIDWHWKSNSTWM